MSIDVPSMLGHRGEAECCMNGERAADHDHTLYVVAAPTREPNPIVFGDE